MGGVSGSNSSAHHPNAGPCPLLLTSCYSSRLSVGILPSFIGAVPLDSSATFRRLHLPHSWWKYSYSNCWSLVLIQTSRTAPGRRQMVVLLTPKFHITCQVLFMPPWWQLGWADMVLLFSRLPHRLPTLLLASTTILSMRFT